MKPLCSEACVVRDRGEGSFPLQCKQSSSTDSPYGVVHLELHGGGMLGVQVTRKAWQQRSSIKFQRRKPEPNFSSLRSQNVTSSERPFFIAVAEIANDVSCPSSYLSLK